MSDTKKKDFTPGWVPKDGGDAFAVKIRGGIPVGHVGHAGHADHAAKKTGQESDGSPAILPPDNGKSSRKRPELHVDDYVEGVLKGDKALLARTITLIESSAGSHAERAAKVLEKLLPHTGNSLRIGISGPPGAGKSTFIEALGNYLLDLGNKVAVLAIDPSSSITRGSILGDKTRMELLSRRDNCFIRPSPTGGTLGGVTRKTRQTIPVCEAAGYDTIIIETVGVGQAEITVRSMVDFFLLLTIPGAGDELQAIKKGVVELADAVLVNKADGVNKNKAAAARDEIERALRYLAPATPVTTGWQPRVLTCSALEGEGIAETWDLIKEFEEITRSSGVFTWRREQQDVEWMFTLVKDSLEESFFHHPKVKTEIPRLTQQVIRRDISPTSAAAYLLEIFFDKKNFS